MRLITLGNLLLPLPSTPRHTRLSPLPAKRLAAVSQESGAPRLRRRIEILPDALAVDRTG